MVSPILFFPVFMYIVSHRGNKDKQ